MYLDYQADSSWDSSNFSVCLVLHTLMAFLMIVPSLGDNLNMLTNSDLLIMINRGPLMLCAFQSKRDNGLFHSFSKLIN